MRADQNHRRWLVGCIVLLLFAAGCYQQGSEVEPQPLSPVQPGPTNTFLPTEAPFPTPEPLVEPTQDMFLEPPPTDAFAEGNSELGAPVDIEPTSDFFVDMPTTDPFGSAAAFPTTDFSGGIAQVPTIDPFLQQQIPTEQPQIDPVFLTATAIIAGATATESANMTATAQGYGIGIPTFTPFPSATTFFPGQTQQPTGADCTYTVQRGDNLFRIARNYNVDLQTLANYNNIANPSLILVGQQVIIPNCGGTGQIPGGEPPPVTGGTGCSSPYTVQQGDTLFKISLRCNVPVMSIASANGIQNINLILINQQLTIPAS